MCIVYIYVYMNVYICALCLHVPCTTIIKNIWDNLVVVKLNLGFLIGIKMTHSNKRFFLCFLFFNMRTANTLSTSKPGSLKLWVPCFFGLHIFAVCTCLCWKWYSYFRDGILIVDSSYTYSYCLFFILRIRVYSQYIYRIYFFLVCLM